MLKLKVDWRLLFAAVEIYRIFTRLNVTSNCQCTHTLSVRHIWFYVAIKILPCFQLLVYWCWGKCWNSSFLTRSRLKESETLFAVFINVKIGKRWFLHLNVLKQVSIWTHAYIYFFCTQLSSVDSQSEAEYESECRDFWGFISWRSWCWLSTAMQKCLSHWLLSPQSPYCTLDIESVSSNLLCQWVLSRQLAHFKCGDVSALNIWIPSRPLPTASCWWIVLE